MNYRHAFHAGNFADVLKHAVLMRILAHLMQKDTAIRVIDTHAGAGLYDLKGDAASRTGEWVDGIGRLNEGPLDSAAETILAGYRNALAAFSPDGRLYPGSPALIRHVLRPQDRASFNELHPETLRDLRRALPRDDR
ncbi:MAG: 23S rRNA (adenine(2030)-N(6))-methyltransferase RlmJ, partial [Rhabdaerophilum sp.]